MEPTTDYAALARERDLYRARYLALLERHTALLEHLRAATQAPATHAAPSEQHPEPTATDLLALWQAYEAERAQAATSLSLRKTLRQCGRALTDTLRPADDRHTPHDLAALPADFCHTCAQRGLANTSTALLLTHLRRFLKWLDNRGLNIDHPAPAPKLRCTTHQEPIFLTADELARLARLTGLTPAQTEARDAFLLAALTGLRHSDLRQLQRANVREGAIHISMQKTGRSVVVELCQGARRLLAPRLERPHNNGALFQLGNVSHDARRVRRLCQLAHIDAPAERIRYSGLERQRTLAPKWQLVGTHTARRTFVALALERGIPAEVVMRWTGHSSHNALRPYIGLADSTRRRHMAALDDAL